MKNKLGVFIYYEYFSLSLSDSNNLIWHNKTQKWDRYTRYIRKLQYGIKINKNEK